MKTILAYLRLMRPANIVTAIADILAGWAVTQYDDDLYTGGNNCLLFLILATIGLYGGGVVMNDVADYELDKIERPERPIPSGLASRNGAIILGMSLLVAGIFSASIVSMLSGIIAFMVAVLALIYNFFGKHHNFFGPINMGMCRGGNFLLGMSVTGYFLFFWPLAIIPILYIAGITMISRGEVVGGDKKAIAYAGIMYGVVISGLVFISILFSHGRGIFQMQYLFDLFFILLFAMLIIRPLIGAYKNPEPNNIRKAVKTGVISLIVMDAAMATSFMDWRYGIIILALLPISLLLSKVFAVT